MQLPATFKQLVDILKTFPSLGPRSAERLALFLFQKKPAEIKKLGQALLKIPATTFCRYCFNLSESQNQVCVICQKKERHNGTICVVEDVLDLIAIEKKGIYQGLYHVLGGVLKIGQKDNRQNLHLLELLNRLNKEKVTEVIIATNPTTIGDITASFLKETIQEKFSKIKITRLSRGLPTGSDLEYADKESLEGSFKGRVGF